ncbi:MAG: LD-carboxypeptidase [Balneolaceae bacterium]|nr:LD-carboxypeptidase [Balneolaceae bacterium]
MYSRRQFLRNLSLLGGALAVPVSRTRAADGAVPLSPPALRPGDTIGLVSPASALPEQAEYDRVLQRVRDLGYRVREGAHARNTWGNFGGTDRERANDLHAMFRDPKVDAVMAFRGGWGSARILPLLDFSLIVSHPKALIGFSDITSLLMAVYARTGMVTFHGPVGRSEWTPFTTGCFHRVLRQGGTGALAGADAGDKGEVRTLREGRAEGVLLGGNLSVLTAMAGTGWLPDFEGAVLFLEEVGEDYYRIDRMLTQLGQTGLLKGLAGFAFGRCASCERGTPRAHGLREVLEQHLLPLGIPAVMGLPFGHVDHSLTIPVGVRARLDAGTGTLELLESPVAHEEEG